MNVEEVMKKLEEIKVELYNNVTSSEDKSPVQVETQDRLPIDEDLAGEEVKIKRTKGEKVKDRGNMSRSSSQDGSKNPDKDYVFGKNAPSVDELQNQLDGLFRKYEVADLCDDLKDVIDAIENFKPPEDGSLHHNIDGILADFQSAGDIITDIEDNIKWMGNELNLYRGSYGRWEISPLYEDKKDIEAVKE